VTYRFLPHTADILLELTAPDLAGLFADATSVVRVLLVGNSPVEPLESRSVTVRAEGADELLLQFMSELFTEFQLSTFVPTKLEIHEVASCELRGLLRGELFDDARHEPQPEVKAVTRHRLEVVRSDSGWRATVLLDM